MSAKDRQVSPEFGDPPWINDGQNNLIQTRPPGTLDVERLIAHLRQQVRNDSDSAAWRHGVEYAIECIESAAYAEEETP